MLLIIDLAYYLCSQHGNLKEITNAKHKVDVMHAPIVGEMEITQQGLAYLRHYGYINSI